MEIIEEKQGGINIFKLNGRLDSNTSQGFEKKLFQAISDGSKSVVVDFSDLDYISSAGLRVILKATKAIKREDGRIMLCSMQDYVKEVFEIAGFDSFLPIVSTMDDVLKHALVSPLTPLPQEDGPPPKATDPSDSKTITH